MFKTERNYAAHSRALTNTFLAYSVSLLSLLDVTPCTLVEICRRPRFLHMEKASSIVTCANLYHLSHATSYLKMALFKTTDRFETYEW